MAVVDQRDGDARGDAGIQSPTLPRGATSATVDVQPKTKDGGRDELTVVLSAQPRNKRLLSCVALYLSAEVKLNYGKVDSVLTPNPLPLLLLQACIETLVALDQPPSSQPAAHAAAGLCRRFGSQVPATVSRAGHRYSGRIDASAAPLKAVGKVKVSCRRLGSGVRLKIRPTRKGQLLRKAVGPKVLVGLYNPRAAASSVSARITFRQ